MSAPAFAPALVCDRATLYCARAEAVYPHLAPSSVAMVWSDGRYGLGKSEPGGWDDGGIDSLPGWYEPHLRAWTRICAASATIYLWNTAPGWARLDPLLRELGWCFAGLIIWDKGVAQVTNYHQRPENYTRWPDVTEVCGVYQRNAWEYTARGGQNQTADDLNWIRKWLIAEWSAAGLRSSDADQACETPGGMASRHYFPGDQWCLPTEQNFLKMAEFAAQRGRPRQGLPYLVHPDALQPTPRGTYAYLQAEAKAARVPFLLPERLSNVWSQPPVAGKDRLQLPDGTVHPCQKPLVFAEYALTVSSRPGDLILDPFAGTNRVALACRRLPEQEARHVIGVEMDPRWVDAVRPSLVRDLTVNIPGQAGLFTRAATT